LHRTLRLSILLALSLALLAPTVASAAPGGHADALRALRAAERALSPPAPLAAGVSVGSRDATLALHELALKMDALRPAEQRRANRLLQRPTNKDDRNPFGREAKGSPVCSAHFCVHWSARKADAPASEAFLKAVSAATEKAYRVENGELHWRRPKPDALRGQRNGVGADGQTDVYILDLNPNLYGYAVTDPGQKGPRQTAYLVLDNNYLGFPTSPVKSMQVTVAHEYNHILQFNYDNLQDLWMFEATATWAEDKVYANINDYLNYLPALSHRPQDPLTGRSIRVYAEAVWNHWLDSRYGPAVVRDAWADSTKAKPAHFAISADDASIKQHGGKSFSREFAGFAEETAEWQSSDAFPDAKAYPDVKRTDRLGARSTKTVLDNTSFRLYDVKAKGKSVTLSVKAPRGVHSAIALVGREGGTDNGKVTVASRYLGGGGRSNVTLARPGRFNRVTAVVVNADGRAHGKPHRYKSDGSSYSLKQRR
jgi:hypothetical protein